MDYYSKYLKYKSKYLELQKQAGGKCDKTDNICRLKEAGFENDFLTLKDTISESSENSHNDRINNIIKASKKQIDNMIKLKTIDKFSDEDAYKGALFLTDKQIDNMIKLRKNRIFQDLYDGAKLKPVQIDNMIELRKITGIREFAYKGARDLNGNKNTGQIKNMIELKKIEFFEEEFAYKGAKDLDGDKNTGQIKLMIELKNEPYNFSQSHAYECALYLKEGRSLDEIIDIYKKYNKGELKLTELKQKVREELDEAKKLIDDDKKYTEKNKNILIKAGFIDTIPGNYLSKGAELSDTKIKTMIELKNDYKFSDQYAYEGAKISFVGDKKIEKMIELKNSGKTDKEAYDIAKNLNININI